MKISNDKTEKVNNLWKKLNEEGIYTKDQLKKELSKYKLEIGMFTTPI